MQLVVLLHLVVLFHLVVILHLVVLLHLGTFLQILLIMVVFILEIRIGVLEKKIQVNNGRNVEGHGLMLVEGLIKNV